MTFTDPLAEGTLDDLKFFIQTFEDARRTVICPPGLGAKVRALIDEHGVGGYYDVLESDACPPDTYLVADHNAIDAATRQAMQRQRIWSL